MPDNTVSIIGNTVRDCEIRYTPSGMTVATFGVAVNRRWQNKQTQEWEEQVSFFDVKCWGQMAENVSESIPRGTRVVVTGRLEQRSWETDSGDKRSKVEIVADEIAPSLRWATAQVQKIDKREAGQSGASSSNAASPKNSGNYQTTDYSAEEPF